MSMCALLRDCRRTRQFWIKVSISCGYRVDDLVRIIMGNNRNGLPFTLRSFEIVMSNRSYWFDYDRLRPLGYVSLGKALRRWFAWCYRTYWFARYRLHRFRFLLPGNDRRRRFSNHFRHLLCHHWCFFLGDYLGRSFFRDYFRYFPCDHLNRILLCRLFGCGQSQLWRRESLGAAGEGNTQKRCT